MKVKIEGTKMVRKMVDEKMRLINRSSKNDDKMNKLKKKIKKLPVEQRKMAIDAEQVNFNAYREAQKKGDGTRLFCTKGFPALPINKVLNKIMNEEVTILNRILKDSAKMDELKKKIKKLPVELRREVARAEQLAFGEHYEKITIGERRKKAELGKKIEVVFGVQGQNKLKNTIRSIEKSLEATPKTGKLEVAQAQQLIRDFTKEVEKLTLVGFAGLGEATKAMISTLKTSAQSTDKGGKQ